MALKILLADDSMTAQNMGKKILTDGGYEVVAVSNGAAALKKISEEKPHIVVLDIYMPGYSGLEVCERLKSTIETSRVPVLLTVGKLEPFRPEDAVRVRAEGVIIKPFEATELLAAIEKASGHVKIAPPPPPKVEEPEPWQEDSVAPELETAVAPSVEIPEEVADAPAFGLDEMVSAISTEAPEFAKTKSYGFSASSIPDDDDLLCEAQAGAAAEVEAVASQDEGSASSEFETQAPDVFTSAGGDPLLEGSAHVGPVTTSFEPEVFVDNPDPGEVPIERDPNLWVNDSVGTTERLADLEVTAQPKSEPVDAPMDPALIARENLMSEVSAFPAEYQHVQEDESVSEANPEEANAELADAVESSQEIAEPTPAEEQPKAAEDDFDALVSAALARFEPEQEVATNGHEEQGAEVVASSWRAEKAALDESERTASLEREMQIAMAVASGAAGFNAGQPERTFAGHATNGNGASSYEGASTLATQHREQSVEDVPSFGGHNKPMESLAAEEPVAHVEDAVAEREDANPQPQIVEHELALGAAAGAMLGNSLGQSKTALEQERLVQAIGRVLERLKPQIVSEIAKELSDEK